MLLKSLAFLHESLPPSSVCYPPLKATADQYLQKGYVNKSPISIKNIKTVKNSIIYDHIFFRYNGNEPVILNDINLQINKGETVAFVGHSGSGKTTLINLLPRFYDIKSGHIEIDGIDIRDYK